VSISPSLKKRLQASADKAKSARQSSRFKKVLGKLVADGLIQTNQVYAPSRGKISIKDCLWAGEFEQRILELLPALVLKRPGIFSDLEHLPADLLGVIKALRRGEATEDFRSVPAASYRQWVARVGHKGKEPTLLKSFRFSQADLGCLRDLSELGYSESDAVRMGLKLMCEKFLGEGEPTDMRATKI